MRFHNNSSLSIKNLAQRSIILTLTEFPTCLYIFFSLYWNVSGNDCNLNYSLVDNLRLSGPYTGIIAIATKVGI